MGRNNDKWLYEINSKSSLFHLNLKEIWRYKDLLFFFTFDKTKKVGNPT